MKILKFKNKNDFFKVFVSNTQRVFINNLWEKY